MMIQAPGAMSKIRSDSARGFESTFQRATYAVNFETTLSILVPHHIFQAVFCIRLVRRY